MEKRKLEYEDAVTLIEQAPILIWRANTEKLCDYFNDRWMAFTGRTFEQEYGNGWAEGVHPDDFQRCLDIYTTSFDKREIFEMRYRLKRFDGEYRWIFDRGVPFFNNKIFKGYIGSCIDITGQVLAELEIEKINQEKILKLEQLLPMCSWCKKIRIDDSKTVKWISLESYLKTNESLKITHGICEECKQNI